MSDLLADIATLVGTESPSTDLEAVAAVCDVAAGIGQRHLGVPPERVDLDGRPHLHWRFGTTTKVAVIGHLDTVWPLGTLARWPFTVDGDRATGPGVFDMKAGVVAAFTALSGLADLNGVEVLLTTDEELGSPTSRTFIEEVGRRAAAVLVFEPPADGALKVARKGVGMYRLSVTGRAAHAGLEPERGVNAAVELAHQVIAVAALGDSAAGTSVTPTVLSAGTATNVVPAGAALDIDVRTTTAAETDRVDGALRALTSVLDGSALELSGGPNRPPMPRESSAALFERAQRLAEKLGLAPLRGVEVGGGSDGNFTAGVGTPTLDGLGAVGAGAHAEGEHIVVSELDGRVALIRGLVDDLLR